LSTDRSDERTLIRHEEEAAIDRRTVDAGSVHVRKRVESEPYRETVERAIEHGDVERQAAVEGDSGEIETLPDGSVSIPIFEERVVVTKQLVVRERVVVHKRTTNEAHEIQTELRRERVEVDADEGVDLERG
jgi:uncharacterized protein (TIGR02271 family)